MKPVKFHFEQPKESPGYLMWQVSMLWQRSMNRALKAFELTHTQFVILAALTWLSQQQEQVTQVEIANHSKIDRMMTSKILRNLQGRGLIDRKEHATDTRAKCVFLTRRGTQRIGKALAVVEATDQDFFRNVAGNLPNFLDQMKSLLPEE
ncbi:MAG: MarR family winged helix-turn-helix transcriptional regulator [Saprospiraceae bacterium]